MDKKIEVLLAGPTDGEKTRIAKLIALHAEVLADPEYDELATDYSLQHEAFLAADDLAFYPSDLAVVEENGRPRCDNIRAEVRARRRAALAAAESEAT